MFGRNSKKVRRNKTYEQMMSEEGRDPLLPQRSLSSGPANKQPLSARAWILLGSLYVLIGTVEILLAAVWRHWLGVAIGFGVMKLGSSLVGLGITGGRAPPLPPGASVVARLRHVAGRIVSWGSDKVQRLIFAFRWLVYLYGAFAVLLIVVHIASPDPRIAGFPDKCSSRFGCSRVAELSSHGARGMQPVRIASTLNATQAAVEAWINSQNRARILYSAPGFVHVRFLSLIWGFADDFFVGLRCDDHSSGDDRKEGDVRDGLLVVETQGQLRVGKGDLGVNARRNKGFIEWLEQAKDELPVGNCAA
jgi:uncharacterized protein (DUF1499 family)